MRSWGRYSLQATGVVGLAVVIGWTGLGEAGFRGVLLAAVVALPLQLALFGLVVVQKTGSLGFLAAWVGGTLLRIAAVGVVAWIVFRADDVDPLAALLTLAGLLFVLLLLELRELRATGTGSNQGRTRR